MSIALYQYRLFWDGHHGALRCGHQLQVLASAPTLPGAESLQVEEIDYAPEVNVAQLREAGGDWREMSPAEVAAAQSLIETLGPTPPMPLAAAA
jgi:hypothetical protein